VEGLDDLREILERARWLTIGEALEERIARTNWQEIAPNSTAWLEMVATRLGKTTTFLARCLAGARFVRDVLVPKYGAKAGVLERLPLSAIEELKRLYRRAPTEVAPTLRQLLDKSITYRDLMRANRSAIVENRVASAQFEREALEAILPWLEERYPDGTLFVGDQRRSLQKFDLLITDPILSWIDAAEVKFFLSSRNLRQIADQLSGVTSFVRRLWFIVPKDAEALARTVAEALANSGVRNLSVVSFDPLSGEVRQVSDGVADDEQTLRRNNLKSQVVHRGLGLAARKQL
jgi:hypothetical protein